MKKYCWRFDICHAGEVSAGIRGYSDVVTVTVRSGDPGGDEGEFRDYMTSVLREWFDGAAVFNENDVDVLLKEE